MNKNLIKEKFKQNLYYIIIFITSMIVMIFFPMFGSEIGLEWKAPSTPAGWVLYIVTKTLVAILNVIIFFSFMQQAKINVRDDEKYKEALSIVRMLREKVYIPRDPKKWERKAYTSKGITIFLSSVITLIGLSNALLKYDYIELISYIIVIVLGIIFGLLQMANAEDYWTNEFYDYAMMIKKEKEKEEQTNGDSNR